MFTNLLISFLTNKIFTALLLLYMTHLKIIFGDLRLDALFEETQDLINNHYRFQQNSQDEFYISND